MVLVVGDVEAYQLVGLSVLMLVEGEYQAAELLFRRADLEVVVTPELHPGVGEVLGVADGQADDVSLLHLRRVEVACTQEYAHHVVDAAGILLLLPLVLALVGDAVHLQVAVAARVGVPQLVHVVALALACSFPEINRCEVFCRAQRQQCVAHHEDVVELAVAACYEAGLIDRLPLVCRLGGLHAGTAHLEPHELPVEVQVVVELLACLEGSVLNAALGHGRDN